MRVTELMHTPVVSCPSSTPIRDVARLMRDRGVGSVLVIDEIGYLAGIVTDRDLAIRAIGEGRSGEVEVEQVMTRDVVSVPLYADSSHAAALMRKRGVRRLPVVDDHDQPHGVVSLDDLIRELGAEADALMAATTVPRHGRPGS